ncbi:MAG: DUF3800 domain-containing protein [Pseudobutyrivibrio sp.]|nr:DUF3800 domain-containing protein [Pseudobutyrivibrio sp.]
MKEKILSVFVDESGDFGKLDTKSPFYHVTMVLHEQTNDISDNVNRLESLLANWGYPNHYIHVGPLIRREKPYTEELRENRKHIFNALFQFIQHAPIQYITLSMNKAKCNNQTKLAYTDHLSKLLAVVLKENMEYFMSFSKIILYYDYGQDELVRILTTTFNILFMNVEIRHVAPADYRLLQVADFICTVEMTDEKNELSKSEKDFFWSARDFKKNILKPIRKKLLHKVTYP